MTGRITHTERALLTSQLATLRAAFSPGILIINWHSLGIPAFVASFRKARCMHSCPAESWHLSRAQPSDLSLFLPRTVGIYMPSTHSHLRYAN